MLHNEINHFQTLFHAVIITIGDAFDKGSYIVLENHLVFPNHLVLDCDFILERNNHLPNIL